MKFYVEVTARGAEPKNVEVDVTSEVGFQFRVRVGGAEHTVEELGRGLGELALLVDGHSSTHWFRETGAGLQATDGAHVFSVRVRDEQARLAEALLGGRARRPAGAEVRSIMPGIVTRVLVAEGAEVERDAPLLTIEAMKMENEVRAEASGIVRKIHVAPGNTVNTGDLLVEVAPAPAAPT